MNKKSFILHCDSLEILEMLSDEQCWKLFRKIKAYHSGEEYLCKDQSVSIAFTSFKNQFDREALKYENICERNRSNWLKWWRPKKTQKTQMVKMGLKNNPNNLDSDSDSDSDSDNNILFEKFRTLYNKKIGKPKCIKKFNSLNIETQNKILESVPLYLSTITDKQYQKHPLTYLNGEHRNDEIIETKTTQQQEDYTNLDIFDSYIRQWWSGYEFLKDKLGKTKFYEIKSKRTETKKYFT